MKAKREGSDVRLSGRYGEVYGFHCPYGAGKNTMIRMALRLTRPTSDDVGLFANEVTDCDALGRLGSLVDGDTFFRILSGRDNLRVPVRTRGIHCRRIEKVAQRVDLSRDAKRKFKG